MIQRTAGHRALGLSFGTADKRDQFLTGTTFSDQGFVLAHCQTIVAICTAGRCPLHFSLEHARNVHNRIYTFKKGIATQKIRDVAMDKRAFRDSIAAAKFATDLLVL